MDIRYEEITRLSGFPPQAAVFPYIYFCARDRSDSPVADVRAPCMGIKRASDPSPIRHRLRARDTALEIDVR